MSVWNELEALSSRFSSWLDGMARSLETWAASERGQTILAGLDYMADASRASDFYKRAGWYLPVYPDFLRFASEQTTFQIPFDERRATALIGPSSPHWRWIVEGMKTSPALATRAEYLDDVVYSLEHQRWRAAVCTTLPCIEGLISDAAGVFRDMRVGRRLSKFLDDDKGSMLAFAAIPALGVIDEELFARVEFTESDAPVRLNRHWTLHGRPSPRATPEEALRAWSMLIAVVEIIDGPLITRAESVPAPRMSFEGPLARMGRRAPVRAAATA